MLELVSALIIGISTGYFVGHSLIKQGNALLNSLLQPLLRIGCISIFGLILLQYGLIAFILFCVSLISTMWVIIIHKTW